MVAIPRPCDSRWERYKPMLPLQVTLFVFAAINMVCSLIYYLTTARLGSTMYSLLVGALSLVIVGYWIFIYLKRIMDPTWSLIIYGITAVLTAASFFSRIEGSVKCKQKCGFWRFTTAIVGVEMLAVLGLCFIAFRVRREAKAVGGAGVGV